MLGGIKTCTSRTKPYGEVGDQFTAFGAMFEIRAVERLPLFEVACSFYRQEGVESPAAFKLLWEKLHPHKGWVGHQIVVVHHFRRVDS